MKKIHLEEHLKQLQEISERLDNEALPLEESLKLFEMGINLYRKSIAELGEIKDRVTILIDGMEMPLDEDGGDEE